MTKTYGALTSNVVLYPGMAGWHFIAVPKATSAVIKKECGGMQRGWGSLPVTVTLGGTAWKTSIFPDKKSGTYLLPLKAAVRKKEGIYAGDSVTFSIDVLA